MRRGIGIVVLLAGGAVLWLSGQSAQSTALSRTGEAALQYLDSGSAVVRDGQVFVTGVARSDLARAQAEAVLAPLGQGLGGVEVEVIPLAAPFVTQGRKTGRSIQLEGYAPDGRDGLIRADGALPEWEALVTAGREALADLVSGDFSLSDKSLTVTGKVRTDADRKAVRARLLIVEAATGATIFSEIDVVPLVEDFYTEASKGRDGAIGFSGYVPSDLGRALLGDGAGALVRADGARANWEILAQAGQTALAPLHSGNWLIENERLLVTGVARDAGTADMARQALAGLDPALAEARITIVPFVAPYVTRGRKSADGAVQLSGVGPDWSDGLVRADGAPGDWRTRMQAARAALAPLVAGDFTLSDQTLALRGLARDAAAREASIAALAGLGADEVWHDISVIPWVAPFRTKGRKSPDGTLVLSGHVPAPYGRALLRGAPDLVLADGAPGAWEALAGAGQAALLDLVEGVWTVEGSTLMVSGEAPDAETVAKLRADLTELDRLPEATVRHALRVARAPALAPTRNPHAEGAGE